MRALGLKHWIVACALSLTAQPALACQYEFAPEPIGGPSAKFIASKMAAAATFVDLAIADGASDVRLPDGKVSPWSKAVSFRVLKRWKGTSTDRFILFGSIAPESGPDGGWHLTHWVDEQGRIEPYESVREATVLPPTGGTSCDPGALSAKVGHTYLTLREADGRLLGWVEYHPGSRPRGSTPIADVGLWPDSDWARQMAMAVGPPKAGPPQMPAGAPDPTRATVRFRRPVTVRAATELLERVGAQPFAVTVSRGGVTSDYRLSGDLAWSGIVADAARWAEAAGTDPSTVQAKAKAILDAYPLRDIANDTAKRELALMVLALADGPREQGPALISAVSVFAGSNVQRALASDASIADVLPSVRVRNRVATAPPLPAVSADPLPQIDPVEIDRKLVALTGQTIPAQRLDGTWQFVGDENVAFDEQVMRLEIKDGAVAATLPCGSSRGTYRLTGRVLQLDMPTPSLKSCPQRASFWHADYFFGDNGALTVRFRGDTLELIGNGGAYRFKRT